MQRTLYQLLGVAATATDEQIGEAYALLESRLRARADGGDVEAGNQLKFAHEAYTILRNAELRRQYDLKQSTKRVVTTVTTVPTDSAETTSNDFSESSYRTKFGPLAGQFREFLHGRTRTLVVAAIGMIALVLGIWHLRPTEANQLERRADQYLQLFDALNFEASYEFLTPDLRSKISREAYLRQNADQQGTAAKVLSVKVTEPSKRGYVIVVSKLPAGDEVKTRTNWVMDGGQWYRDLASDRSDLVKEMSGSSGLVAGDRALPVAFELEDLDTSWFYNESGRSEGSRFAVWPETKFFVRNTGNVAIDYLEIMVEYYDTKEKGVFASDTDYIVGSSDRPLQPGERSALTNMKSTVRYEMDFGQWASTLMAGPLGKDNPAIQRIEVRIYAKESSGSQWTRIH